MRPRRRLPLLLVAVLLLPWSCSWLEPVDRSASRHFLRDRPVELAIPVLQDGTVNLSELGARGGLAERRGHGDPEDNPLLARAWESGEAPSYGVLGSSGGIELREIAVRARYPSRQGQATLEARVLHDRPFEVSLATLDASGGWRMLERARSVDWGSGLHFALLAIPLPGNRLDDFEHLQLFLTERGPGAQVLLPIRLQPVW